MVRMAVESIRGHGDIMLVIETVLIMMEMIKPNGVGEIWKDWRVNAAFGLESAGT